MKFITFEGIDFCGKSTQIKLLEKYLLDNNKKVYLVREPGGTKISESIREILLDNKNNNLFIETELLLFSSARAQLTREIIKPYLKKGYYVLSDRFHDSTTAYQGYGKGINLDIIHKINEFSIGDVIPDITFLIDISVEEMISRRKGYKLDRMENNNIDFYKRVREGFLNIAKQSSRFKIIDGTKSIEYIHEQIIHHVRNIL